MLDPSLFLVRACYKNYTVTSAVAVASHLLDYWNKKIQQSWQTSALAVHLPLARLVSMCVIFCPLPSSSIVILVFYLFFYRHQWKTCVRTVTVSVNTVHWFDTSCSGTPVNNLHNSYITSTVPGLHFCRWQYMRSSANFRTVFSESQNANPLDAEL